MNEELRDEFIRRALQNCPGLDYIIVIYRGLVEDILNGSYSFASVEANLMKDISFNYISENLGDIQVCLTDFWGKRSMTQLVYMGISEGFKVVIVDNFDTVFIACLPEVLDFEKIYTCPGVFLLKSKYDLWAEVVGDLDDVVDAVRRAIP